jgi:hypothetical protein
LPHNDGVVGAVNSSRIAGMPEVVEFMLGASEVLTGECMHRNSRQCVVNMLPSAPRLPVCP